jgi:hypothetical protein
VSAVCCVLYAVQCTCESFTCSVVCLDVVRMAEFEKEICMDEQIHLCTYALALPPSARASACLSNGGTDLCNLHASLCSLLQLKRPSVSLPSRANDITISQFRINLRNPAFSHGYDLHNKVQTLRQRESIKTRIPA